MSADNSPTLREQTEEMEAQQLSSRAVLARESRGRLYPEEDCPVRTAFQRDVDRITYSKAFRRLKHKTQVFLRPEGDHYQTRLTHTLEVARIARTIARGLRLNEDLTEAIALGHDLGHTPFGHAGERALDAVMPGGFTHYNQSLRVVDRLEKDGEGLNLTWEVRNGIVRHTTGELASTLEGQVVRLADQIAYLNHDIEDALRAGVIYPMDIPLDCTLILGFTHGTRIAMLVTDTIRASRDGDTIRQSEEVASAMAALKAFMFDSVYTNPVAKGEEGKAQEMLKRMFAYYCENPHELSGEFQQICAAEGVERAVCDYIAGMTDSFSVATYQNLFIPTSWEVK